MSRIDSVRTQLRDVLLLPEQAAAIELRASVQAAVLVPLHLKRGVLHAIFTERHHDLPRHAGEISFPGGRRDPDDPDLVATALREVHEEIGLPPEAVEVIGALEPTPTVVTGYAIYPFVGFVPGNFRWTPSDREVAAVIDLPLPAVASGYGRRRLVRRGATLHTDTYVVDGHMIWGATARIVSDLLDRVGESFAGTEAEGAAGASAA
jgi:8-oxo-dGTP pyrophosphatase MutT (NUDIX family)